MDKLKTTEKAENNTMLATGFAEWLAENHYRLCNLEKGVYYWENEDEVKTSQQLFEIFKEQSKPLIIEMKDWHHQCGDGCCDSYGTDIFLNGERLDEQNAEDSKNALIVVLEELGYKVDITCC